MVVRRVKIWKRRRILIALRAVVISSVAERSSLQNGQRSNCENFDHRLLLIPNPQSLIPNYSTLLSNFRVQGLGLARGACCSLIACECLT